MERRVEDRHVRQRRERRLRRLDPLQRAGVVQRREDRQLVDVDLDEGGDEGRLEEAGTAVHDAVPDGDRRAVVERRTVLGEGVEHDLEPGRVVGDRELARVLRVGRGDGPFDKLRDRSSGREEHGVLRLPHRLADALDQARRQHGLGIHVDQLVLEGRRSAVDDQHDTHRDASPCAWIAVIAIVLTMSSTSAPRDRSLMGLLSPCSTGPIATAPADRCTAL